MSTTTWARSVAAASLLAAAAALPALANPIVVDFEPGGEFLLDGDSYSQGGFNFTAVGDFATIDPSFCDPVTEFCAVGNNTSVLSAWNDATIDLSHSARLFKLGSFSAAFLPSPFLDFSGSQIKLQINGIAAGGASVAASFDLLEDGNTGNFLFGSYDASALGVLSALSFNVCFDDGISCGPSQFLNDAQFSLDDLSLLTVPEPGAAWLVALSLAGLALTRRRSH